MSASLLVELLTEELPPKALKELGVNFASFIYEELVRQNFVVKTEVPRLGFATPRRLAVMVPKVSAQAAVQEKEVQGPATSAPQAAVAGFAKKHGVAVESLQKQKTPKGEVFVARAKTGGASLHAILPEIVDKALKRLPIPKVMRWGSGEEQFVRPVHGLVMLYGEQVVPGKVLGLESRKVTLGHRFMADGEIQLWSADDYESTLLEKGKVVVDFEKREKEIQKQLESEAKRQGASLGIDYGVLLNEVTALVEFPAVYTGVFDSAFMEVPQECLILTMRQNQKYFPLFDQSGGLLPKFLIVSNMKVADPRHIVGGNERVVRPRLEDARFFYNQDRKVRLEARVPQLGKVVYHNKLGSQLDRVGRIKLLAGAIARMLGADALKAERAAELAKADLLSGMVGEFPELQGIMGRYYARHDGEPAEVADAIEAHYRPRFAGDRLPEGPIACAVALADKLDALAGLFSIGEQPTGEKDPFGLRRAALGAIRILVERKLALSLPELLRSASTPYKGGNLAPLQGFVYDRFAGYLKDLGFSTLQVDAVLSKHPPRLDLVPQQLEAVKAFQALPEAESLIAANKRIRNILRKSEAAEGALDPKLLKEPEEKALFQSMQKVGSEVHKFIDAGNYEASLGATATLKLSVDPFFDKVLVNAEDAKLRANRHALLKELENLMNQFADISKLSE
ncbi:MAG TPA: glycine--tRNA ligase subunit beta [Burkholderiales bacterium]